MSNVIVVTPTLMDCSLNQTQTLTVPHSTQEYKWVVRGGGGGQINPSMDEHRIG